LASGKERGVGLKERERRERGGIERESRTFTYLISLSKRERGEGERESRAFTYLISLSLSLSLSPPCRRRSTQVLERPLRHIFVKGGMHLGILEGRWSPKEECTCLLAPPPPAYPLPPPPPRFLRHKRSSRRLSR
jgi:hypothetical protein